MIVTFSGWCQIDDKDVRFQNPEDETTISGVEYLLLSYNEKENYVLENVIAAIRDSHDNEWTEIDVLEDY